MTIASELILLNATKTAIKTAIEAKGVTVGAVPFGSYAAKITEISGGGGGTLLEWSQEYYDAVYAAGPGSYQRPADWLPLPVVGNTEQKFVGLHTVWPDANFLALSAAGNYTVDWGDDVVENYNSGVVAYHEYNYSTHDVTNATLCSRGYKQVVVSVTPQSGVSLTTLNLNIKHNRTGLQAYASGWLDITISGPNLTSLQIAGNSVTENVRHLYLEKAQLISNNNIASFDYVFNGCKKLALVPAWVVRTSGAVNMSNMFYACYSLQTVPLLNTQAVTDMYNMFYNCYSLQTVPLFNTQVVTNMSFMFMACPSLQTVPLLNTQAVTDMYNMFGYCYSLQTVPLLNTQAVTNMYNMFYACYSLQTVPLFNTAAVTNMYNMFYACYSLQTVPLFNTQAVTNMSRMFNNCYSLQTVPLLNTQAVTDTSYMFMGCYSLQTVPLFNTQAVTGMSYMFMACLSLQTVPLLNTQAVTDMYNMFNNCSSLQTVPLLNTQAVTIMSNMFYACSSLQTVPLFNTQAVTYMSGMFQNCYSLKTVPLFNTAAVTTMASMFYACFSLSQVPALNTTAVSSSGNLSSMFNGCNNLSRIEAKNFRFTFSVASCKLSAAALNEIYTNLPTVTGQTLTVTGNYGVTSDTPSIATAKGWTITG